MIGHPPITEAYPEQAWADGLALLHSLRSSQLRRMAAPLLRAAAVREAGRYSLAALVAIDQVMVDKEAAELRAA